MEIEEKIKECYKKGMSYSEISDLIKNEFGIDKEKLLQILKNKIEQKRAAKEPEL